MIGVRPFRQGDLPAVVAIVRSLPDYFTDDVPGLVERDAAGQSAWVLTNDGNVTGFAVAARKTAASAEILWMAVNPALRGKGQGTTLLSHVLGCLAADGVRMVEVKTLDRSADYPFYAATRAFWERNGFIQIDTIDPLPGWQPGNPAAIYVAAVNQSSEQAARVRVVAYVVRATGTGPELLVFDHADYPEAGTQVPAGGVNAGERLEDAVLREIAEETGVRNVTIRASLGVQHRTRPETATPQVAIFYHATADDRRARWIHNVTGTGDDEGMRFECFFVPLPEAAGLLADGQDEFLQALPFTRLGRLGSRLIAASSRADLGSAGLTWRPRTMIATRPAPASLRATAAD